MYLHWKWELSEITDLLFLSTETNCHATLKRSQPDPEEGECDESLSGMKKRFRLAKNLSPQESGDLIVSKDSVAPNHVNLSLQREDSSCKATPSVTPEPNQGGIVFPEDFPEHLRALINLDNLDLENELEDVRAQKVSFISA